MSPAENSPVARIGAALEKRFDIGIAVHEGLPGLEALATMNERSVCRRYQDRAIDEPLVQLLCATALSAPSKSDLQQASIIRVLDQEKRKAIYDLLPTSSWAANAPEFLVVCGDHSRVRHLFEVRGREFPNNHLDLFFNASVDAGIVLATLVQAANFAGLGCCPISEIREHVETVSEMLGLPKWVFPLAGVSLGYPVELEPLTPRFSLNATLHEDVYDSTRASEAVQEYDPRRIQLRPYKTQREPERYGEAPEYGWGEEKFRQYSVPQRTDFGAYVRKQGFNLD